MINSALIKNSNNNANYKSAFFDFSKQGFSPLLFKSKISYYDHDLKEGNLNCNYVGINENFLDTGLMKDKLNITNNLNINSPFNMNYLDRRNSLTKQNFKGETFCAKPFSNFSSNLNINNNNFEKNYNFNCINSNFINQNVAFSNAFTASNSKKVFNVKKYNSEEVRKEIKYADDYSFKKNKILSDNENNENFNVESENNSKACPEEDILITRQVRNSLSKRGQVKRKLLLKQDKVKKGSISTENLNERNFDNKCFKKIKKIKLNKEKFNKFKNINSIINIRNKNQNLIPSINENLKKVGLNNKSSSLCLDWEKEDFKSFSFLKHKRKANIISSLFGFQNNITENESCFNNKKLSFKKLDKKKNRKNPKSEEELDSIYSVYGSNESDSIYDVKEKKFKSIKINQKKSKENRKKLIRQSTNIQLLKKGLIAKPTTSNLNKSFKFSKNIINDKESIIQHKINKDNNKNEISSLQDDKSLKVTPKKLCINKTYDSKFPINNNIDIDDEFSFCQNSKSNEKLLKKSSENDIINPLINKFDQEKSLFNLNKDYCEKSMADFDEIFGQNNITKKNRKNSVKKIKHIIDSKTSIIKSEFLNFQNYSDFYIEDKEISKYESIDSTPLQIPTLKSNDINFNKNKEYLYESFDDDETLKKYSTFCNNKIKDNMIEMIIWGKPNNKKLTFGECPLTVFADIYQRGKNIYTNFRNNFPISNNKENVNTEKEYFLKKASEQESFDLLAFFTNTMREISYRVSNFPVFNFDLKFDNYNQQQISIRKEKKVYATNITEKFIKNGLKKQITMNPEVKSIHELFELNEEAEFENEKENKEMGEEETKPNLINDKQKNRTSKNEKSSLKAKKSSEETESELELENEEEEKGYDCYICGQIFINGQGLGGHMSRKHPNQSERYKSKKETRERRNNKREILYRAQRILLKKYRQDYDKLKENAEGRKIIKKYCKDHKQEYYRLRKEVKFSRSMRIKPS